MGSKVSWCPSLVVGSPSRRLLPWNDQASFGHGFVMSATTEHGGEDVFGSTSGEIRLGWLTRRITRLDPGFGTCPNYGGLVETITKTAISVGDSIPNI